MGFLKIPNNIFELFIRDALTNADRKVFALVIKKTIGFHKEWDFISLSQFMRLTGLSRQSVNDSITRLVKRGLLVKKTGSPKRPNSWKIFNDGNNYSSSQVGLTSQLQVVTPGRHTKDNIQKKRKKINKKKKDFSSQEKKLTKKQIDQIWSELESASAKERNNGYK